MKVLLFDVVILVVVLVLVRHACSMHMTTSYELFLSDDSHYASPARSFVVRSPLRVVAYAELRAEE